MSTEVTASARRSVSSDMFADLTDAPVLSIRANGSNLTVTFDADLDQPTIDAITARMTSRDDADQAARADLSDLLTNDTTASPLAKAVAAYLLGGAT
ncbi:hypothetical protein FB382_004343 [Nocardioides ginsengisegetis]|uniref:Uncharacterized protein n=1 Tax=Nocardioides ginsengisegetis TaxID=661491 RepID=A0A7W3J470_9ACTN|nr:hypothetical protein [Nocardioides ginsengisegetis]MBA8805998.1 hypothetical protein [Nocardioides ginsengisegetis]